MAATMTTEHSGSGDLHRSMELLWGTKERPARGPKPGLTLDRIVDAAVELADRDGLSALSMRKVAAELGVGTMSLYRYVPGKGELIDLMLDRVSGPVEHLERYRGEGWRTTLELVARGSWELYANHPWLLQVNQSRPVLGPNSMAGFDFALAALDGLGLTGQERVGILVAVEHYVAGAARSSVLWKQAAQQSGVSDEEFWATQEPYLVRAMTTGAYPQVAALPEDVFSASDEANMELGLRLLLDGVAGLIESKGVADR